MKSLQQEAEEYFDNNIFCDGITPFEEDISMRCFIAGVSSKYVQIEKIKAQIKIYQSLLDQCENHNAAICKYMIKKRDVLEQQLKELQQ
jgi:DNA-binding transcriptional MerR regulator